MKRLLLLVALSLFTLSAVCQKIKVEQGSIDFLKSEQSFDIVFTYDDMKVGKKTEADYVQEKIEDKNKKGEGKGEEWHKQWISDRSERFEPKFIELFNTHISKKNGPTIEKDSGNYLLTMNTHHTEPGFNVGVARRNAAVSTTCVFTEKSTGNIIAIISIKNSSANDFWGADFDTAYRIQESYGKAGRELAKFLIKQLKLK